VYFDETDRFIRKSLVGLYPHHAGFEQGILRAEIANPPSLETLQARFKNFVVIGERENFLGTIIDYAQTHDLNLTLEDAEEEVSELKGQVASKGKAQGRVRIVKRKDQVNLMREGEILVSTMTTPDFVPAMRKAGAIVTDEGGITCHAAIISRELKKPCVIATKLATSVFKDGDIVEVDAEKGIVRKI
jgi:phosphohistidine swiveling domain-containing protein